MSNASAEEKRERKRLHKSCDVEFCANNGTYRGVSDNFSMSGLFIRTDHFPALQSVVSIKVHLPDGLTSELEGRVKRIERASDDTEPAAGQTFKGGMGIEILERDSHYIKFFMSLLGSPKF